MLTGQQFLGLMAALIVSVPAFAAADQYLYNDGSLAAEGVIAVQQHTVYVEIIKEELRSDNNDQQQIHQFAAVVALVKRCIRDTATANEQFDNAVLWFNDQFLFGDKRNEDVAQNQNITEGPVLGSQPQEDHYDSNGNPTWDTDNSTKTIRRFGSSSGDANPDDGGVAESYEGPSPRPGRYVGCFVPDGFLHAIGADDPYATGTDTSGADPAPSMGLNNIGLVKDLIELDNHPACSGCVFNYSGSFYITDPNGFNWIIDKYVYAAVLTGPAEAGAPVDADCGGAANVHFNSDGSTASGCDAEQHRDDAEDDGTVDDPNHCYSDTSGECDADHGDPTDTPRQETAKFTTMEPMYTVHLQVDSDDQAIRDEALWAWDSGTTRNGQPRYEDEAGGNCATDNTDPRCSIEYTALIVVDFEAFDDVGALFTGEDEIQRNGKLHGDGGADNLTDESLAGNSHNANPEATGPNPGHTHDTVSLDLFFMYHKQSDCDAYHAAQPVSENGVEDTSDACGAPYFTSANPYWIDGAGTVEFGTPPRVDTDPTCNTAQDPARSAELAVRTWIVCDIDGVYGADGEFHAHDGSQTIG